MSVELTIREREQVREQAQKALRERLNERQPKKEQYSTDTGKAGRFIGGTLVWAKAAVVPIALLAALASAVRTIQTASEIYIAAGSHPIGVLIAAIAFTLATEGALFSLALAQEGESMRRRSQQRARRVFSLASLWRALRVRIGVEQPLRHDEMPERDGLGTVIWIAFAFAVSANAYMGLRPLLEEIGAVSLQSFLGSLVTASATLQLTFIVDMVAVLFPPLMALKAGHLTAKFAAEIAEAASAGNAAYEADLTAWRAAYANPLETDEGKELLAEHLQNKLSVKQAKENAKRPTPPPVMTAVYPSNGSNNGHSAHVIEQG